MKTHEGFPSESLPFQPFMARIGGRDTCITLRFLEHCCREEQRNADQKRFDEAHKEAVALLTRVTHDLEEISFFQG